MSEPIYIYTALEHRQSASQKLLLAAAKQWCLKNGYPGKKLLVERPRFGKPYFKNAPEVFFSVSHSGSFWLCAISRQPLGLDLQQIRQTQTLKIAQRFFHPDEAAFVKAQPSDFFKVWTAKESYVKYTGQGIGGSFSAFSVISPDGHFQNPDKVLLRFLPFAPGYELCLCCSRPADIYFEALKPLP